MALWFGILRDCPVGLVAGGVLACASSIIGIKNRAGAKCLASDVIIRGAGKNNRRFRGFAFRSFDDDCRIAELRN
jgi:hypothetical protein